MKTPGTSKADLIEKIGRMHENLESYEVRDKEVRANLTRILRYEATNSYDFRSPSSYPRDVMSWIDIAFAIGELRADANYSMLLESREEMRREIEALKNPNPSEFPPTHTK